MSLGIYSATNSLSSPSAQHPIKLTNLLNLSLPTPEASVWVQNHMQPINTTQKQTQMNINPKWKENPPPFSLNSKKLIVALTQSPRTEIGKTVDYHKLLRIRPWLLGEAFNGNQSIISKLPSINNIRSFLSTLRNNQLRTKAISGSSKLH